MLILSDMKFNQKQHAPTPPELQSNYQSINLVTAQCHYQNF